MRAATFLIAVLLATVWAPDAALAAKKKKVDPLELARVLLRDNHPDRALNVLSEVSDAEGEDIDRGEAMRLRGLAEHGVGRYADAAKSFTAAIALGKIDPRTWLALADAHFLAGDSGACLEVLGRAPPAVWSEPRASRLEALSHYKLGARTLAFDAVDRGLLRFGRDPELERVQVRVLLELGLFHQVVAVATTLLEQPGAQPKDSLALAGALASRREIGRAIELLEAAALRFPDDREVREGLAKAYFGKGSMRTAAGILGPLALEHPESALVAAELYRRSGQGARALQLNGLVPNPVEKARQRLNLLVEQERYVQAVALDARLSRLGLLEDQQLAYALAYAHFVAGDRPRLEALLSQITDVDLFSRGTAIRRALETCDQDVWQCP